MADAKGAYIGGVPVQFKDAAAREMISDEYNSAETYAKGNLCIYNGKIYEAIKETIGTWDATAWKETTLAEVNAKMRSDITNLTEKTTMSWGGVNAHVILTTKSWAQGDGGAIWTVPEDGWYFVRARFIKNESSEDYASNIQLQLKSEKNGLLAYATITKLTSMTAIDLPTVGRFAKGDKISVNAHVAQAGLKFNTTIFDVKLSSY